MPDPILATKLYIPSPRSNIVHRPRLIERLNDGFPSGVQLTIISAPAGFGKTTLISEWIAAGKRAAWLSLDEGDNDLNRFLIYFVTALQTIFPNLGKDPLGMLQSQQPPSSESILTTLLNEVSSLPENFILVLDDYHLIDARPVDLALGFLLDHLPRQMHLVITTREDPSLPIARYRARGRLTELRAADLRFTPAEAADFLNQVMGLNLSVDEIAALEARTEGWIAGLQLAAVSMQGHPDTTAFIQSFTGNHRFILDYLLEEVLNQQSESIQKFLLRTSILERMCGPLCDAVLLDPSISGQEALEYLDCANLFIVPLDNERRWYRYHHLFADLLRQRLQQVGHPTGSRDNIGGRHMAPSRQYRQVSAGNATSFIGDEGKAVAVYHTRASVWYQENGLKSEAFQHALAAKDFSRAAGLAELAWPAMDGRFQSTIYLGWVKVLPDELIRARPVLSVAYAWALLNSGELDAGEIRLQDAERWLEPSVERNVPPQAPSTAMVVVDEGQFRTLPASIATARAYIAQTRGDVSDTLRYTKQALNLLPKDDHLKRGPAAALLALAHWTNGDLEKAHHALADAMANFQLIGSIHFAISGTFGLADIRITQGLLHDAIQTYEHALRVAAEQDVPVLRGTANLYLGLSELHRELGDLEAATQYLVKSEQLGEQAALSGWTNRLCRVKARFKEALGDLDGALDLLDIVERQNFKSSVPDVRPIAAMKARLWVKKGRLVEAQGWVKERKLSVDDTLSYLREFEHVTLARVLIAEYQSEHTDRCILEAVGLLERLLEAAQKGGRIGTAIEILVLQALAYEALGNISSALAALNQALTLAEPEGYVRIFVDEGQPMNHLLSEAARRFGDNADSKGGVRDYARKLLAVFESEGLPDPRDAHTAGYMPFGRGNQVGESLNEPISQRELQILELLAQGLSNHEICERLYLALDTVKGHNRRIFDKLQVQKRTEAVVRARELGLIKT